MTKSSDKKTLNLASTTDPVEKAKARLAKAKLALMKVEKSISASNRKLRDTAIFTIGGAFVAFHTSERLEDRRIAEAIWSKLMHANSQLLKDDRRLQALEVVFNLMTPQNSTELKRKSSTATNTVSASDQADEGNSNVV
jgi:hypothetical protein